MNDDQLEESKAMDDPLLHKKKCKQCCSEIEFNSVKCPVCQSFQDWRSHLNFSSSVLALLVALISVTGAVGPTIISMFEPEESKVVLNFQRIGPDRLILLATNSGNKPGILGGSRLTIKMEDENGTGSEWGIPMDVGRGTQTIINKDSILEISLFQSGKPLGDLIINKDTSEEDYKKLNSGECDLQVNAIQFDGAITEHKFMLRCGDLIGVLFRGTDG
jgi:hypothetical protein